MQLRRKIVMSLEQKRNLVQLRQSTQPRYYPGNKHLLLNGPVFFSGFYSCFFCNSSPPPHRFIFVPYSPGSTFSFSIFKLTASYLTDTDGQELRNSQTKLVQMVTHVTPIWETPISSFRLKILKWGPLGSAQSLHASYTIESHSKIHPTTSH